MPVTREQFERGLTYDQYKAQMTRNQEQFEQNERGVNISPEDLAAFKSLPQPVNVLALAEDWCGDVVANLPVLGKLARESGTLNVRVLLRDQNLDVMDQYLKDGQFRSIPCFIFLDQSFKELGVWIERPASVTQLREQRRREFYAANPDLGSPDAPLAELPEEKRVKAQQFMGTFRRETAQWQNSEVIRELRELAQRSAASVA